MKRGQCILLLWLHLAVILSLITCFLRQKWKVIFWLAEWIISFKSESVGKQDFHLEKNWIHTWSLVERLSGLQKNYNIEFILSYHPAFYSSDFISGFSIWIYELTIIWNIITRKHSIKNEWDFFQNKNWMKLCYSVFGSSSWKWD